MSNFVEDRDTGWQWRIGRADAAVWRGVWRTVGGHEIHARLDWELAAHVQLERMRRAA